VLAVDRVAVATGPKLFVDQIEADNWPMLWRQPFNDFEALTSGWGISRREGQCPTLAIGGDATVTDG